VAGNFIGLELFIHCEAKTAPFYFCNSFVKSFFIRIIIGRHIP